MPKSFTIFVSGYEVSQRRLDDRLLFIVLDHDNVWPQSTIPTSCC
ncbi:MAG: hypothetical protein U9Q70_05310 [Chloroflexota bacterium]|nr:hypothetical protein [Chloroflexota bacterium]